MFPFKKYLVIPLALIVVLLLAGCGTTQSEKVVKDFYAALKARDYTKAAALVDKNTTNEVSFAKSVKENKSSADIIFSQVSYNIVKTEEKANTSKVTLKITQVDYTTVFNDKLSSYIQEKILNNSELLTKSDEDVFNELVLPYFKKNINSRTKHITSDTVINLKKASNKWVISDDDQLQKAVLGNYNEAIKSYQNN